MVFDLETLKTFFPRHFPAYLMSSPLVRAADRPKGLTSFAYEGFEFHLAGKLASTTSQVDSFPIYKISSITTRSPLLLA